MSSFLVKLATYAAVYALGYFHAPVAAFVKTKALPWFKATFTNQGGQ